MIVGVCCGRCGGNVFMATCDHFRGTGHEWVLASVCMICRAVHWTEEGCSDCRAAENGDGVSFGDQGAAAMVHAPTCPDPSKARAVCSCGQNVSCSACGWGSGVNQCKCVREGWNTWDSTSQ